MKIALALFVGMLLQTAYAQDKFDPFPNGSAAPYHLDFTRLFASADAEKADRVTLARDVEVLEAMRGTVGSDGDHLLRALQLNEAVQKRLARHAIYLYLRYAVDTRDEKSRDERNALYDEVDGKTTFLSDEILRLSDAHLAKVIKQQPKLETLRYAIESIRRRREHTLSEPEEKVLAATTSLGVDWQFDLYQKLISRIKFPSVTVNGERLDVYRQRTAIAIGPDRVAREEAFHKRWEGLASQRDLFAFTLLHLAASRNAFAHLNHFGDAASASYFRRDLTRPGVKSLLERVAGNAPVYKRYEQFSADRIGKTMGYDVTNVWDLSAHPAEMEPPHFTIDQARQLITEAMAPLGEEYGRQLRELLDPAKGRMDIVPGPNRKSGGFSQGSIGSESVFFSGGFAGSYDDVRVLAHESTHAVQRQLMNANHLPIAYAVGANYLAEALAIFNELVLADFMAAHATDPRLRRFYLEQFLDGKGMEAFIVAPEAELEEAVYDGVAAGTIRGADDLDALTRRIYDRYTIWPARHEELKQRWMVIPLMYEDPFYDLNYVYGSIIGLRLYSMYVSDPKAFAPRYVGMMRNGYTAPPPTLLQQFFDIDLDDPRLLTDVVKLLDTRVDQLRAEDER